MTPLMVFRLHKMRQGHPEWMSVIILIRFLFVSGENRSAADRFRLPSEEGEEGIGCDKLAVELLVRHCPEGEDALDDGEDSPRAAGDADEQDSEDSRADLVDVKIMEAY